MAQITKYTANQVLMPDRAGVPRANVQSYADTTMARAIGGLGETLESVAATLQQREEQKENFKAQDAERRFELDMGRQLEERALTMVDDGAGFHDDFMTNVYNPARAQFLSSLPERLREQYSLILGDDGSRSAAWSIKAATKERDQLYSWYETALGESREQLATAISMDPDAYDDLLQRGMSEIDASGLPPSQKEAQKRAWEEMAQVAHLNRLLETNPERVLRELGADPRYLTPTTQFNLLSAAVQSVESAGDPNAVSPVGAIGLMQVMPATAGDIARELKDPNWPSNGSQLDKAAYLANPVVNKRYGEYYLRKQIREFAGKGGLEAALIAYNGGPGRAKAWIESGFNDAVLPKETREYYKKVLARLPTLPTEAGQRSTVQTGDGRVAPEAKFNPASVKIEFSDRATSQAQRYGSRAGEAGVSKDLTDRVRASFAALGLDTVKVNSGHRNEQHNREAGGAAGSQHVHGNAMDIDVTGMTHAQRVELIRTLSANGVTGLGIGANIIHVDTAGRRAWGYASSSGGGEVPKWAKQAIDEHLAGNAAPGRPGQSGRYGTLSYSNRQKFIQAADTAVTKMANDAAKASTAQKGEMRRLIANEIATLQATGVSTGGLRDEDVSTILGEADYNKYVADRTRAQRIYDATSGIEQMSAEEMETRRQEYNPVPGSATYADDIQVENAVQRRIDRTLQERARNPAAAAMRFPDVAQAWAAVQASETPDPQTAQEFIRLNLERQKEFNLKPGSEQPLPRESSMAIGRGLARIPELGGGNVNEVNAAILQEYEALRQLFGDFTDEVILQALADYKGIGVNTGAVITGYMEAIQAGGDPMGRISQRLSAAEDRDQVEQLEEPGFFSRVGGWLFGDDEEALPDDEGAAAGAAEPSALLDEKVDRVINMMDVYGTLDPEDEAYLIGRFGESAVRIAKERRGSQ